MNRAGCFSSTLRQYLLIFILAIVSSFANGEETYAQLLNTADEIRSADPEQSKLLLESIDPEALNKAETDLLNYLLAYNTSLTGHLDEAGERFKKLAAETTIKNIRFRALASLLTMQTGMKNWSEAFKTSSLLLELLKNNDTTTDSSATEMANFSIAVFYNHLGEYKLAQQFSSKIIQNSNSPRMQCVATSEYLYSQIELSIGSIRNEYLDEAVNLCRATNDKILIHSIVAHRAKYLLDKNDSQQALALLKDIISEVEATKYQAMIAAYYELIAKTHLRLDQNIQAEKYAMIIVDTKSEHQYDQAITTAYYLLSQIAEKRRDFDTAFVYFKKHSEARQKNFDQENAKLLAIQKAKLDNVEKANRIKLLNKENDLLKIRLALDTKSTQNNRLTIALLTLVLILIFLWAYKTRLNQTTLRRMAETDELTGIANRHHFNQLAKTAINYCFSNNQPLSFILFDLDHFKNINDSFGHQVGDWALQNAVKAASSVCRNNDVIGRVGGEEFGILLPGCSMHKAEQLAEDCRQAIEELDSVGSGQVFKITASFGVADAKTCGYDFFKLFAGADAALYQSKDKGRNQVFLYKPDHLAINL
jgi:diguanylate cyclase (GGDEF)-like protein